MEITWIQILQIGGISGIVSGVIISITKYFLDKKLQDRRMLFQARVKAYAHLIGATRTFFIREEDWEGADPSLEKINRRIEEGFSEALLLSDGKLKKAIELHMDALRAANERIWSVGREEINNKEYKGWQKSEDDLIKALRDEVLG